jgi:formylglycine-generating enzyme required for sulfatase activity
LLWDHQSEQGLEEQFNPINKSINIKGNFNDMALIPAGVFQMSDENRKNFYSVELDSFYIDKHEVTNQQYKEFIDANAKWRKTTINGMNNNNYLKDWIGDNYPSGKGRYPVTFVDWEAANTYALWTKKRLPTEAEWEKASAGCDIDISGEIKRESWNKINDVDTYGKPNKNGIYGMDGNVWEWCSNWEYKYDSEYNTQKIIKNPQGPIFGDRKSLRGGPWTNQARIDKSVILEGGRLALYPRERLVHVGFRCAKNPNDVNK